MAFANSMLPRFLTISLWVRCDIVQNKLSLFICRVFFVLQYLEVYV